MSVCVRVFVIVGGDLCFCKLGWRFTGGGCDGCFVIGGEISIMHHFGCEVLWRLLAHGELVDAAIGWLTILLLHTIYK